MVRALDYYPKPIPWVVGKLFCVVTGPQTLCEVRIDHVEGLLHVLLMKKNGQSYLTTQNMIFSVTYYLELRNVIIIYCTSFFYQPWSNWLFA